jgi:hypothetical protein
MKRFTLLAVLTAALSGACTARVIAQPVAYRAPDLVEVSPGVSVIADYDEPIFFSDGFYWWYVDGAWYRSTYYTGGWIIASPPALIIGIREPHRWRHHRPAGWHGTHRPVPSHHLQRPRVRDHRTHR